MLSVLVPTYNRNCHLLATILAQQCAKIDGLEWEVVVVDDGSTDAAAMASNRWVRQIEGVRLVENGRNVGRAAIRNRAVELSKGDWLLFLDDDVMPADERFVERYVKVMAKDKWDVICGGVKALSKKEDETSLRWIYDAYAEEKMTLEWRRANPFMCFTTQNFAARRTVFDKVRFDETLKQYGFEDALFGIELGEKKFRIRHSNNPVEHLGLEPNAEYLHKTELAMQNLHQLGAPMTERAPVAKLFTKLCGWHLYWPLRLWHALFGGLERRLLCSRYPSVHVFQLYKLGYYATIAR